MGANLNPLCPCRAGYAVDCGGLRRGCHGCDGGGAEPAASTTRSTHKSVVEWSVQDARTNTTALEMVVALSSAAIVCCMLTWWHLRHLFCYVSWDNRDRRRKVLQAPSKIAPTDMRNLKPTIPRTRPRRATAMQASHTCLERLLVATLARVSCMT